MYSYSVFKVHIFASIIFADVVGSSGLEPPTSRLSGARSNHLSYEPISMVIAFYFLSFLRFPIYFFCSFYRTGGD